ncbi:MAG: VCBS repeat-containing protein [Acidobacteriota bacterium]
MNSRKDKRHHRLFFLWLAGLFFLGPLMNSLGTEGGAPVWPMCRKHLIHSGANESAAVSDINNDGRLDIVAGEHWFEAPQWIQHRMREIPFVSGYIDDLSNFAMDVNGDRYPDLIASSWFSKKLSWFENPRRHDGDFSHRLWQEHVIESGFNYELILLVDLDGDGQAREILPNYGTSSQIAWFEAVESGGTVEWKKHLVGEIPEVRGIHGVGLGDVNGDRRPDILTPRGWFEAPKDARSGSWLFHSDYRLLSPHGQASPIWTYDVNADGRMDLVYGAGHHYGVYWLENGTQGWTEHVIDNSWSQAHAVTLVDLDRDGKLDLLTGKRYLAHDIDPGSYEPLGLYWYRWASPGKFIKHVIDYGTAAGTGVQTPAVDIDGDGDIDIVAPGKSGLFLFEQIDFPRQKSRPPS